MANIEGANAASSGKEDKYTGSFLKSFNLNNLYARSANNAMGSTGSRSSAGGGFSGMPSGNGWTAEDYKNYGDYEKRKAKIGRKNERQTHALGQAAADNDTERTLILNSDKAQHEMGAIRVNRAVSVGQGQQFAPKPAAKPRTRRNTNVNPNA